MRPTTNFTLHAILAAALAALAAASAAAQSPPTLRIVTETPMAPKDIEVLSYSWGQPQAAGRVSKVDAFTIKQGVQPADPGQSGEWIADVERPSAGSASSEKGGTEDINIGVGELQEGKKKGNVEYSWKVEEGESAPPRPRPSDVTLKRGQSAAPGGVSVAAGDVTGDGAASSSGLPTGKRQHKPVVVSAPLDKGSVRVKVKFPWAACKVGTRYPLLQLSGDGGTYDLHDVTVASCGGSASAPTEEVAFYYNRIAFNTATTRDKP